MQNPVLTPQEMFDILARERGWMFNAGGQIIWDQARGGAAAGGPLGGQAVFALAQVVDKNGEPIELARGEYLNGGYHAEERALKALEKHIAPNAALQGGKLTVLVDQVPCCGHRHDCRGKLQSYAFRKGLTLEIWLPTRPKVRGAGNVAPKTAMRTSMQTRVPGWHLELYRPEVDEPCCRQGRKATLKQKHGWGTG